VTIAYVNAGTFAGNNTASIAPGVPASPVAGNRFVAFVGGKPYNTTTGTPTGYTKQAAATSGTTGVGNGTGSTYCVGYDHNVTGSESGTVTFTVSPNGDPSMARIFQFSKDSSKTWAVTGTALADTNNAGDNIISATGTMISIATGDMLVWAATMPNDNDLIGSPSMSVPGCTVDTPTVIASDTTTFGNDGIIFYYYALVTAGASTGAPVFTAVTGPLAGGGTDPDDTAVPLVRLREVSPPTGSIAATLGGVTASLAGSQADAEETSGDLAATLGGVTASMEAREVDAGTLGATLGSVTAAFEASEVDSGTLAGTLGAVTSSFDAREVNTGDAASTLGGVTSSFTGSTGIATGSVAATLGGVTSAFEANEVDAGDMAATLGGVTASFEGSVVEPVTGDLAATLGGATCALQGEAEAPSRTGGWNQLQGILDDIRNQPSTPYVEPLWPNEVERHRPAQPAVVTQYVPVPITEDDQRWGTE
jgi:hypothetical protein